VFVVCALKCIYDIPERVSIFVCVSGKEREYLCIYESVIMRMRARTHKVSQMLLQSVQCVAVFCTVLQCDAVCCSVLQCVAACCGVFVRAYSHGQLNVEAECCNVLQRIAVCCSVLQCVAVCCSVLQSATVCCSVLKCVAMRCNVAQCVTVCMCVRTHTVSQML